MHLTASLSLLALAITRASAIWPAPTELKTGSSPLWIAPSVAVTYNGQSLNCGTDYTPTGPGFQSKQIVEGGVSRAWKGLFEKNFVPWKLHPRHELPNYEPDASGQKTSITKLEITQTGNDTDSTFKPLAGQVDESYSLDIGTDGVAKISAVSSVGVLRALETFVQLFYQHSSGKAIYTNLAPVSIKDSPKFPHRGLLIDVSRNWFPVGNIYRTLDAMAFNKLNRLHLHMTDSQSWPLEIPAIPELAQKGSYGPNLTYSPADIRDIQTYAVHRGIEVIMEIDTPGHIATVAHSHPELITAFNAQPWDQFCAEPPCGQFKLNDSRVDTFLDKLMDDLMPRLSPFTAYFHTGGDEIHVNDSLVDPTIRSNDKSVIQPYLQAFVDKNHARVRKAGLAPFVWEEIPTEWNVTLGKDVVVQTWLGGSSVKKLTGMGHKVIDADYNFWYLDCGRGQWLNFDNGPSFNTYYPFNDWCGPLKNWRLIYSHNPTAGLTDEEAKLVLGGEAAVWAETIDEVNLDDIIWPRGSALAEVLWSGNTDGSGNNRSQVEAAPRLAEFRERLVARGIGAGPVQMVFCTQGNGTTCSL